VICLQRKPAAASPAHIGDVLRGGSQLTCIHTRRSARSAGRGAQSRRRAAPRQLYATSPVVPRGVPAVRPCRRGSPSRSFVLCDQQPAWTGWAVRGPGDVAERRGTVRSVAQLSAAGHPAIDRGTRRHGHAASGRGRTLGRGAHRDDLHIGPWIVVVVDVDRQWLSVEVPTACVDCGNRVRDRRQAGAPLPLTARLLARADTQHAATSAVGATGPATIRSSRAPRQATTRSRQETSVQPRNHGPGLRITRGYRSYSAGVGVG
jgi:hypothetical protein